MRKILLLIVFSSLLIFSIGCSQDSSGSTNNDEQLKIATGTTTGAYYPVGGMMASILSENMEGYNFTAESTGGNAENARLIDSKQAHIGLFGSDHLYNAYHGVNSFEGNDPIENLSGFSTLYETPFQTVTLEKNDIQSISDLEGKSIAVGGPGSGSAVKAEAMLEALGFVDGENITLKYLNFSEGSSAMVDGIVDAIMLTVGIPSGNVQELAATHDIVLVPVSESELDVILEKLPFFKEGVIPAGTYDGLNEDILTFKWYNEIAVDAELGEDLVYEMAKVLFENHDQFKQSHSAMVNVIPENAPDTVIPLHPGAEKYYKEVGWLK
ncbi:TAXI family TRAP transporter solute-binding subunit [Bacillus sp. Marseille-P3661]|uniref:TAXI family TRAP transporter solute-binding subunit n=1 Tax=Bacillus sp. Marseille-P3661 TaxID=1936234 RepID=UPI0015E1B3E0|nr:TAXI family TRAP transporter solute-binding subunit [Bacillus sp. Marseille-P3661]